MRAWRDPPADVSGVHLAGRKVEECTFVFEIFLGYGKIQYEARWVGGECLADSPLEQVMLLFA